MKRLAMLRWPAVALTLLLAMIPADSSSQSAGNPDVREGVAPLDLNNDGDDDILVFGHENEGSARGPLYQAYTFLGSLLASQFILDDHTNFQFFTADVVPGGGDEVVIGAYRESDGLFRIEVRAAGGALLAGRYVTGPTVSRHQIFPIDISSHAGVEIGLGYAFEADNISGYQIWRKNGATLTMTSGKTVLGKIFTDHQWGSCDFNGDGSGDVFVGAERTSDRAGVYVMRDGLTTAAIVAGKYVSGALFDRHQWMCANFNGYPAAGSPRELAHTMSRKSDQAAVYQIWDNTGTQIYGRFVDGGAFDDHEWRVAQDGDPASDCCPELVVLKRRPSDHTHAFQMWDGNANTLVGQAFVNGPAVTVTDWCTAEANGVPGDGEEITVVYARDSDGAVGFTSFNKSGGAALSGQFIAGTGWIGPQVFPLWHSGTAHATMGFLLQDASGGAPQLLNWHILDPATPYQIWGKAVLTPGVITP